MESATTVILRDASGKMHHGILFERRLRVSVYKISGKYGRFDRNSYYLQHFRVIQIS